MSKKIIREGLAVLELPETVFYNPVQEFNRDISVLAVRTYLKKHLWKHKQEEKRIQNRGGLIILDALSASGLRSVRYAKELGESSELVRKIIANDLSESAVELIRKNIISNNVENKVVCSHANAINIINNSTIIWDDTIHIIDLDPFGSGSQFFDASIRSIGNGGLLMVTCTDKAVLCGNSSESCFARYGSMSLKTRSCHEMALRIVLKSLESHASIYGRYIKPLLSVSVDFYVRLFVQVFIQQIETKKSASKLSHVHQCKQCETFEFQKMGEIKPLKNQKASLSNNPNREMIFKPAEVVLSNRCSICSSKKNLGGPIWSESLHDKEFIYSMLKELEVKDMATNLGTHKRIEGVLNMCYEELEVPLMFNFDNMASCLKLQGASYKLVASALLNSGHRVSYSHCVQGGFKTDAPNEVVWDIFCQLFENKKQSLKPDTVENNEKKTLQERILSRKDRKKDYRFTFNLGCHTKSQTMLRYQPNPEPYWGPKSKPRARDSCNDNDSDENFGDTQPAMQDESDAKEAYVSQATSDVYAPHTSSENVLIEAQETQQSQVASSNVIPKKHSPSQTPDQSLNQVSLLSFRENSPKIHTKRHKQSTVSPSLPRTVTVVGVKRNRSRRSALRNLLTPSYKSKCEDFARLFGDQVFAVDDDEKLVADYSCALHREILIHGRLYVSTHHLAFYSNLFGWITKLVLDLNEVVELLKTNTYRYIPNAIQVKTAIGDKHVFASFVARDKSYITILRVWQYCLMQEHLSDKDLRNLVHHGYGDVSGEDTDDILDISGEYDGDKSLDKSHEGLIDANPDTTSARSPATKTFNLRRQSSSGGGKRRKHKSQKVIIGNRDDEANNTQVAFPSGSRIQNKHTSDIEFGNKPHNQRKYNSHLSPVSISSTQSTSPVIVLTPHSGFEPSLTRFQQTKSSTATATTSLQILSTSKDFVSSIGPNRAENFPVEQNSDHNPDYVIAVCSCRQHEGQLIVDTEFDISADMLFSLIFTNSKFMNSHMVRRGIKDATSTGWKRSSSLASLSTNACVGSSTTPPTSSSSSSETSSNNKLLRTKQVRLLNYSMDVNHVFAKQVQVNERQNIIEVKPGLYVLKSTTENSGIPYGDIFTCELTYCIMRNGPQSKSRMLVHAFINFRKDRLGWKEALVKTMIERRSIQGIIDFINDLTCSINEYIKSTITGKENLSTKSVQNALSGSTEGANSSFNTSNSTVIGLQQSKQSSSSFINRNNTSDAENKRRLRCIKERKLRRMSKYYATAPQSTPQKPKQQLLDAESSASWTSNMSAGGAPSDMDTDSMLAMFATPKGINVNGHSADGIKNQISYSNTQLDDVTSSAATTTMDTTNNMTMADNLGNESDASNIVITSQDNRSTINNRVDKKKYYASKQEDFQLDVCLTKQLETLNRNMFNILLVLVLLLVLFAVDISVRLLFVTSSSFNR